MVDTNKIAREVLNKTIYAALATVTKDGAPWNSTVMACFDEQLSMYWDSWVKNQHSLNIAHNNQVFIVVYDSTKKPGTGLRSGVYIQAKACQISGVDEVKKYYKLREQANLIIKREPDYFLNDYPRRVYKAEPQKIWLNDKKELGDAWVDIRVEVSLTNLQ